MKDRVLFTTNGAGFIATALIQRLAAEGDIVVYDNCVLRVLKVRRSRRRCFPAVPCVTL
jgi:nucleoside-diphosphate-sugar epimerase